MDTGENTPNGATNSSKNSISNGYIATDIGANGDRARLEAMGYKEV